MKQKMYYLIVVMLVLGIFSTGKAQTFTHPCIPLSGSDLATLKAHVQANESPWKPAYDLLAADSRAQLTYTMQGPFDTVSRNPHINRNPWINDMTAAWYLSLMWYFTNNQNYAIKSRDILLAWANKQKVFIGNEASLDLGDYAFAYGGAASILRGTWSGWTVANTDTLKKLFNNVYWPASACNGYTLGPSNKGALCMAAGTAVAAFSDDPAKVSKIVYLLRTSASSGFPNTLPSGEIGESARDQGHAHGMFSALAFTAEVLWKLGIDVYSELNNRLLATGEYFSRKNEGVAQGYTTFGTTDFLYFTDSTPTWNNGRWGLSLLHGAYVVRKGLSSPYLSRRFMNVPGLVNARDTWFYKSSDNSTATVPALNYTKPTSSLVGTGLTNIDIGVATPAGSGTFSNNVWTVKGAGTEVWTHAADGFHFLYKQVTGNCTVIAKVNAVGNTASNAKAGVMIRSDLTSTAAQRSWIGITPSSRAEAYMHGWTEAWGGANWEKEDRAVPSIPYWVKIERIGEVIATYTSPDGLSWAAQTEGKFSGFTGTAYIGLFVCSVVNGTLNTSTLSNVSITGGTGGVITVPPAPNSVHASPGNGNVILRWLPSFGAASYTVKRSTSLNGTYTNIATGLTATEYTNTGVSNGQAYYYKVCAVNSAGTSADSPADSVTPVQPAASYTLSGTYRIIATHSNKAIEVPGNSTADGAQIKQYTYNGGANQLWIITQISGNDYKVINVNSGKAMDVVSNSTTNGALIEQQPYSSTDNSQIWTIKDIGNGTYTFIGKQSQKSLDVAGAGTADGVAVDIWQYLAVTNQTYRVERVDNTILSGTYQITAYNSGKVLDVNAASLLDGASVIQYTNNSAANQKWTITQVSGNDYNVINVNSGKALDVIGNSNADGTKIEQRTLASGENYQVWNITSNGDGTYRIMNKATNTSLDVTGCSTANGALFQIWPYWGGNCQRFVLTPVSSGLMAAGSKDMLNIEKTVEKTVETVEVFPNPVENELKINLPTTFKGEKHLRLTDLSGKMILSRTFREDHYDLNLVALPSGTYIVKIDNGIEAVSRKIIKK